MRGMGGVFKRGPVWWIRYGHRGRKYRESSKSADRAVALALLKQRLGDLDLATNVASLAPLLVPLGRRGRRTREFTIRRGPTRP